MWRFFGSQFLADFWTFDESYTPWTPNIILFQALIVIFNHLGGVGTVFRFLKSESFSKRSYTPKSLAFGQIRGFSKRLIFLNSVLNHFQSSSSFSGWEETSSGRDSEASARAQQNFIFIWGEQVMEDYCRLTWTIMIILSKYSTEVDCNYNTFQGGTLTNTNREWRSLRRSMRIMCRLKQSSSK